MTLFDRYLKGETIEVYDELYALGSDALAASNFVQTQLVLKETFERVKFNLNVIYQELQAINYPFLTTSQDFQQQPLMPPEADVETLLSELKRKVKDRGCIPLSLEYFYKIVGSCNFCWDWKQYPDIVWEGADPIDIASISELASDLVYDGYKNDDVLVAGDYLQKDNISGSCYNIELTKVPMVDSLLLHDSWNMQFVKYLRTTFENCGFSMANQCNYDSLDVFCSRVRPKLLII